MFRSQQSDGELTQNPDGTFSVRNTGANEEPKYVSFSKAFLVVVSCLLFVGGLGMTGAAAYAFINISSTFAGLLSTEGVVGVLVSGILLCVLAAIGVYGVFNQLIRPMIFYWVVSFALMITILSILGVFTEYINTVDEVAKGGITVYNARQADVNDFFLSTYVKCCIQSTKYCTNPVPDQDLYCAPVQFCSAVNGTSSDPCYVGDYGAHPNDPPKVVADEFCATLTAGGVVGPAVAATGACGGGTGGPSLFFHKLTDFVTGNVQWVFICVGLISGIIFLELVAGGAVIYYVVRVNNGTFENRSNTKRNAREREISNARLSFNHEQEMMAKGNSVRMSNASAISSSARKNQIVNAEYVRDDDDHFEETMPPPPP